MSTPISAVLDEQPFTEVSPGVIAGHTITMVLTHKSVQEQPMHCADCPLPEGCTYPYAKKT